MGRFGDPQENPDLMYKVVEEYKHLWKEAKANADHIAFACGDLDDSLKGCRKDTIGSDIWSPSELRGLPSQVRADLAKCMQQSMRDVT